MCLSSPPELGRRLAGSSRRKPRTRFSSSGFFLTVSFDERRRGCGIHFKIGLQLAAFEDHAPEFFFAGGVVVNDMNGEGPDDFVGGGHGEGGIEGIDGEGVAAGKGVDAADLDVEGFGAPAPAVATES